jgi:hypothetical protein
MSHVRISTMLQNSNEITVQIQRDDNDIDVK